MGVHPYSKKGDCPTRVMNIVWWVDNKHSDRFPINMVSLRLLHQMMLHKVSKATGSIPNDLPIRLRTWCLPRLWMRRKRWQQLHLSENSEHRTRYMFHLLWTYESYKILITWCKCSYWPAETFGHWANGSSLALNPKLLEMSCGMDGLGQEHMKQCCLHSLERKHLFLGPAYTAYDTCLRQQKHESRGYIMIYDIYFKI